MMLYQTYYLLEIYLMLLSIDFADPEQSCYVKRIYAGGDQSFAHYCTASVSMTVCTEDSAFHLFIYLSLTVLSAEQHSTFKMLSLSSQNQEKAGLGSYSISPSHTRAHGAFFSPPTVLQAMLCFLFHTRSHTDEPIGGNVRGCQIKLLLWI